MNDLNMLDIGMIFDMMVESSNDGNEYAYIATQDDFDKF